MLVDLDNVDRYSLRDITKISDFAWSELVLNKKTFLTFEVVDTKNILVIL